MDVWGKPTERREAVARGGCVLLRILMRRPQDENAATAHFDAMAKALSDRVRAACLSDRAQSTASTPRRTLLLQCEMTAQAAGGGIAAQMRFSLRAGDEVLLFHALTAYWNAEGTLQYPRPLRPGHRRHRRHAGRTHKKV